MEIYSKYYCLFIFVGTFLNAFQYVVPDQTLEVYGNPDLSQKPFDTSISFRQNFCEEQKRFQRGELEINLALEGRYLNIALVPSNNFVKRNRTDNSLDVDYPGLQVVLMDEVARRGKFTWRDSFYFVDTLPKGSTWTQYLAWMVDSYDVSVSWWYASPEREALGISFPMGWYDGTSIIVEKKKDSRHFGAFDLFSWSDPFTPGVWFLLIGTLIFTGGLGMYLDPKSRDEKRLDFVLSGIHSSLISFTGQIDIHPSTHAAELVSFSISFFAMLMLSAYTANLASFLVIEKASLASSVNTVEDIVRLKKPVCIDWSAALRETIEKAYPNAIFIKKEADKTALLGVKNDECEYAIVGLSSWEEVSANILMN